MSLVRDGRSVQRFHAMSDWELGQYGEMVWQNIFRASGVHLIPLKDIEAGGAPMADGGKNGKIVLPDFDCSGGTWTAYVEAKAKTQPITFRLKNQLRHGIDKRNYGAYLKASEAFKKNCAVALLELFNEDGSWSGTLLIERLKDLGEPYQAIPGTDQAHMVYWERKRFRNLDSLTQQELANACNGKVGSYRAMLDRVFDRRIQGDLF